MILKFQFEEPFLRGCSTDRGNFWGRSFVGFPPSQSVVRLLLCRIRNTRDNTVNQSYVKISIGTDGHVDVMEGPCTGDLGHNFGVWSSDLPEGR